MAPECDDVLPERLRWVEEAGGRSLGSTVEAARLAGDKLRLAGLLRERGVPTPYSVAWPAEASSYPAVCKPRHGAGSQATFLVRDEGELRRAAGQARAEGWDGGLIVQPFVPGEPASVAFLIGPGRRLALPAVAQHLSADGRFHYRGGRLPLAAESAERAASLAARAVDAVGGLRGYVGVNVVLGSTADGDAAMEINPRMTTSYVGLRALSRFNLAGALLAVAGGREPPSWEWGTEQVYFTAEGRCLGGPKPRRGRDRNRTFKRHPLLGTVVGASRPVRGWDATRSVPTWVPTRSVGTRKAGKKSGRGAQVPERPQGQVHSLSHPPGWLGVTSWAAPAATGGARRAAADP